MKKFLIVFAAALAFVTIAKADDDDANDHFGLSDSCWQVFLSQLSGGDSSLGTYLDSSSTLDTKIDSMMKLIPGLRGKAVKELQKQIIALRKARIDLHKRAIRIIEANMDLLTDVREHCGQDTTVDTTGGDDTTGGADSTGTDSLTILSLNPNPAFFASTVNLTISVIGEQNVTVNIYNQGTATLVKTQSFGLVTGTQTLSVDLTGVPPGSYTVQVLAGTSMETVNLLIL